MNKLSGFVWEKDERAAELAGPAGNPNLARTPRSPLPLTLHLALICFRIPPAPAMLWRIPPSRSQCQGHVLSRTSQPPAHDCAQLSVFKLNPSHTASPTTNQHKPQTLGLLRLPSLLLCELVQRYFHTLTTTKTDRLKTTHCRVPPRLAPQYKPVYVK